MASTASLRARALDFGRRLPWRWLVLWFLLPNVVIIAMWPIGGPGMRAPLAIFGILALLLAQLPWTWPKRIALIAMMLLITTYYVCLSFNLPIWGYRHLPEFMSEVKPWRAPLYVAGAVVFVAAMIVAVWQAPKVRPFLSPWPLALALVAVQAVSLADARISAATDSSYSAAPGPGDRFAPATTLAGLAPTSTQGRNVVLVVVEALGTPASAIERQIFAQSWSFSELGDRYRISSGDIPYYGSTTSAEIRELCGAWGSYTDFAFEQAGCLPARFAAAGYATSAIHTFTSDLFDRANWYPRLGFAQIAFAPDLYRSGIGRCGGLFPGACDREIPALIGARLKDAARRGGPPQFVYWLTLNAHLPVLADDAMGTQDCTLGPPQWRRDQPDICRVFMVHDQLAQALRAMLADPDLPPTDVVIVGDHIPPFFDRESRTRFDGKLVPWFHLRSSR